MCRSRTSAVLDSRAVVVSSLSLSSHSRSVANNFVFFVLRWGSTFIGKDSAEYVAPLAIVCIVWPLAIMSLFFFVFLWWGLPQYYLQVSPIIERRSVGRWNLGESLPNERRASLDSFFFEDADRFPYALLLYRRLLQYQIFMLLSSVSSL